LLAEKEWRLVELFENKTAIFVKEQSYRPWKGFGGQPYVLQQSESLSLHESQFHKGLQLLRRGQIGTLIKKVASKRSAEVER
jgi:hypothetical protein